MGGKIEEDRSAEDQPLDIKMKVIIYFGLGPFAEYRYRINGHLWIDQKNYRNIFPGEPITPISSWEKRYGPVVIE